MKRLLTLLYLPLLITCSDLTTEDITNGRFLDAEGQVLTLSPKPSAVPIGQTLQFTASGGAPPYTFSLAAGGGSIDSNGLYTPPGTVGLAMAAVNDTEGASAFSVITIQATNIPTVTGTTPADAATAIKLNTAITITFSLAVNPATVSIQNSNGSCTGNVQISSDDFSTCWGFQNPTTSDNLTFTINPITTSPTNPLTEGLTYKIRVTTGVTSQAEAVPVTAFETATGFRVFSPLLDVSNLQQWYKADATGLSEGNAVSSWADLSGGGPSASQGTAANQPVFRTNILNGKPVIRYGSDDFLGYADGYLSGDANVTAIAVAQANAAGYVTASTNGRGVYLGWNDNCCARWLTFSTGTMAPLQSFFPSFPLPFRIIAGTSPGSGSSLYRNGSATVTGGGLSAVQSSSGRIGLNFNGDIAEVLIYQPEITAPFRQQVECYLGAKYNLAITGHTCP